jgi:hypothetical protein
MKTSSCPVCGASIIPVPLITVNAKEAANHFVRTSGAVKSRLLEDHIQNLWGGNECRIIRCNKCASRFADPHIAGDATFYDLAFPTTIYPKSRWEFDLTSHLAKKLLGNSGKLLEIGSGSGAFVKQLINLGISTNQIVVTEFSGTALIELQNLGVQVEAVDFRSGVRGGPFQVIVLFQTLEHLDRLDNVILALNSLGTTDAEAFISVPSVEYLDFAQKTLGIIDMPPNHITAFSTNGISELFRRNGWATVNIEVQALNSVKSRFKNGAMRGLSCPSGASQKLISALHKSLMVRFGRPLLVLCAALVVLTNWSLMWRVPPENIWIHIKRESIS